MNAQKVLLHMSLLPQVRNHLPMYHPPNHQPMNHKPMNHQLMNHQLMNHPPMNHPPMNHPPINHLQQLPKNLEDATTKNAMTILFQFLVDFIRELIVVEDASGITIVETIDTFSRPCACMV